MASLATELKTNNKGTSLLAMVQVAQKHGLDATGLSLTIKGLRKQPLPLIALIMPGHYVIVEKVSDKTITYWDPSGGGLGKPDIKRSRTADWTHQWSGAAMVIRTKS